MQHLHRASDLLVRVGLDERVQLLLEPPHDVGQVLSGGRVGNVQVGDGLLQILVLDLRLLLKVVTCKVGNLLKQEKETRRWLLAVKYGVDS